MERRLIFMEKTLSRYGRRFDETSILWTTDMNDNRMVLKCYENYFNDLFKTRGYVFLRDIYEVFGIPIDQTSIVVGWYYRKDNPVGDNFVEFDIVEGPNYFDIDFNVDGSILENF